MDFVQSLALYIQGIMLLGGLIILIYLINRRLKIKKTETFEKRDN